MSTQAVLLLPPNREPGEIPADELCRLVESELGMEEGSITKARLSRVSLDARKGKMLWRAAVTAWKADEEPPPLPPTSPVPIPPVSGPAPRLVIIGSGPAGLFCALDALRAGLQVTVLERGLPVQARRRSIAQLNRGEPTDPESNYAFGEGGAGTYSDGKLYTRSGKKGEPEAVIHEFIAHGAPDSIGWMARPHIGSNLLPKVVEAIRETIEKGGGEIRFEAKAEKIHSENGAVRRVELEGGETLDADAVVLATGHSATDAVLMARASGATIEAKGFAVGVRIEHPQAWLDKIQYQGLSREETGLPASFYECSAQVDERGVYSFCMCPGGWIVPSQAEPETLVVNGMSLSKRDSAFANSGVVVSLEPKDWCGKRGWRWGWPDLVKKAAELSEHPLLHEVVEDPRGGASLDIASGRLPIHPGLDPLYGVRIQVALEVLAARAGGGGNQAPAQNCGDFVREKGPEQALASTSYLPGLTPFDFATLLPKGVARRLRTALTVFENKLPGYLGKAGQMIGVETRTSSPVRILRDPETLETEGLAGLYPCGEGAGFAGGIVSAALDGKRVAAAVAAKLAPAPTV